MASPSNKSSSSSPNSSRVLPNPVLRNSETVNPVRRSFAGSPFLKPSIIPSSRGLNPTTPANSPLDHPQRNCSTYCRDLDEKENGKDHHPRIGKIQPPKITNCTKNFMSPTISASSKISMSPKRKILVQRNEPVRTSLSSSDLKTSSLNSVNASEAIQPTSVDLKPDDCNSIEPSLDSTDLRPALRASSSVRKASKTVSFMVSATKSSGFSDSTNLKASSLNSVNASQAIQPASFDLKPDDCNSIDSTDLRPALRASSSVRKASKTVSFIVSETKSSGFSDYTKFEDADLVNLDNRFQISPASSPLSCQIIAPLDEDPSISPYDPKTNYLSPRPQFLHYRPNPRKRYLYEEEEGKRVEGSFFFKSFWDTGVTEETQSDSSQKSDEVSSNAIDRKEEEEEADHNKSEPCLIDNNNSDGNSVARIERYLYEEEDGKRVEGSLFFESFWDTGVREETQSDGSQKSDEVSSNAIDRKDKEEEEADHNKSEPCLIDNNNSDGNSVARGNSQPSFRNIYKITALILLLCFAFSSVFHTTPLVYRIAHDESSFLMKNTDPYEIYQFEKSKYSGLAEILQVWFFNKAAAFAHGLIFNFQEENHQLSPVRYFNLSDLKEDISVDGYFVLLEEDELLQNNVELEEEAEENSEIMENADEPEQEHEASERHESLESEFIDEDELLQKSAESEEHSEIMEDPERSCEEEEEHQESKRHESLEEELSEEENGKSESEMVETFTTLQERPERVEESEQGSLELDSTDSVSSEMDAPSNVNPPRLETMMSKQVILLILLPPLMAAAIFAHSRRVKTRRQDLSSPENNRRRRRHGRRVLPVGAEERSSCVKGGGSLSSSMSYGSFTAYEKTSTKHGDLEEEIMTPVRRSSRIKTKLGVSDD